MMLVPIFKIMEDFLQATHENVHSDLKLARTLPAELVNPPKTPHTMLKRIFCIQEWVGEDS